MADTIRVMNDNCQWCNAEIFKDYGPKAYYVLPVGVKVDGLKASKPICPLCASQFKIKQIATRIETNNLQEPSNE